MHIFIFLVLIKNINGGGSWNVTPMPNTDVCVQVLRTIEAHGGRGFGNTGECIEVKTNEPLNNGKRKLTAVCSHQTRIGNLDAHLI
ncbi:hypothetical protein HmCmsJML273_04691 [Escherichia coli]|uniref:hypothetical protein n=1 Tax=Escherichia coli TaxID=562 RepID=UPI0010DA11F8|nr:hypothetical protein [Escherichia coli]GDE60741.1 hypothetical protein HmCmsJML273_04691 [Escherichia coli]